MQTLQASSQENKQNTNQKEQKKKGGEKNSLQQMDETLCNKTSRCF